MRRFLSLPIALAAAALAAGALAKLPPPSEEAKAKAEEAKAKAAWSDKVAAFQTCKAQDRAVANYEAQAKKAGKEVKVGAGSAPCADPGPFNAPPAAPAAPASPAKS